MIKEKTLMSSNKYKYQHMDIKVLERDGDNVCAFSASFVHVELNGRISHGLIEVNKTLWDQQSNKRPQGFWVLRTVRKDDGTTTTVLASDKWFFETLSPEERKVFEQRLDKEIGMQS
ncbi:hypothetical protein [Bacillus thuringiensis]|uniref:Uncharacterized protein n=1 Tax=Bacillus thuringiensis TaxID=1428 RepID=A0A9X6TGH8_BACTU|nr:hypothetical protein [Bacillus thuringiensis]PEA85896.1 hypothetical protein CON71_33075 [Bacillus thuringiensis]